VGACGGLLDVAESPESLQSDPVGLMRQVGTRDEVPQDHALRGAESHFRRFHFPGLPFAHRATGRSPSPSTLDLAQAAPTGQYRVHGVHGNYPASRLHQGRRGAASSWLKRAACTSH